ncbi:MAG: HEAT repeat domain-containing protein [Chloroflexi bacterium]|nr:HEAT repeat domain-containing protein [Chloroflexota bacterium]
MSIGAYIEELVDPAQPLAVSKLTQLSALGPAEAALLATHWPEMELRKRQRLVQELIDLEEDSVELDFDAVFFLGLADGDAGVRRDSIRGLWENESREIIDALTGLLADDSDAGVRAEAALALGRFVMQAEFEDVKPAYAKPLDQALRGVFQNESEVVEVRGRALESLGVRAVPWVRDLIEEAFESPDRRLRLSAVHAMGRGCDESWLPALIVELESDDDEMRFEAAGACGAIAGEAATQHLLPLLEDADHEVQEAAIAALGEIGGEVAKAALMELKESEDERVRDAVEEALEALAFADDPLAFHVSGEASG